MQGKNVADVFRSNHKLLVVDAAQMYGEAFSLDQVLRLALVRAKPIVCFTRREAPASKGCLPVVPLAAGICTRLSLDAHADSQFFTAPLWVLDSRLLSQQICKEAGLGSTTLALLSGGELYGLQLEKVQSADLWWRQQQELSRAQALQPTCTEAGLPDRFRDSSLWNYQTVRREHPVYSTSSAVIGMRKPSQHELPLTWSGIKGGLSGLEGGGSHTGLNTGLRRSKVHASIEGW